MTRKAYLVIKCNGQLRLVTPVGYLIGTKANDVPRGAGHGVVRWFNLGWNNLHRPDTITHLGAGLAKNLRTLLCTFTRVGDDLNGMLGNCCDSWFRVSCHFH